MNLPSNPRAIVRLALAGWLAASGVVGLAVLGASRRPEAGKAASVPFEMLASNHMVVQAKINGKGPYRLLFDVGSPVTLINRKAAESSGIVEPGAGKGFLLPIPVEGKAGSLGLGDLEAKDVPVIVMDHPVLKALGGFFARPLDGILGFTFFARFKTTIDYQSRVMTFEPVKYEMRDLMKDLPERLAGPKVAREVVLAPSGLWGLTVGVSDAPPVRGAGVTIAAVVPESPAARAGLEAGDLLTTLDGRWTASVPDAYAAAAGAEPGKPVEVVVVRRGRTLTLSVAPRPGF